MKWQISHNLADKIIVIKTEGVLDKASAGAMRNEGAELIKQHGYLRCLLDHSDAEGVVLGVLDTYSLPKIYDELKISRLLRMAVVVPDRMREDLHFYETVCRNNGYSVSIFFDRNAAVEWLLS